MIKSCMAFRAKFTYFVNFVSYNDVLVIHLMIYSILWICKIKHLILNKGKLVYFNFQNVTLWLTKWGRKLTFVIMHFCNWHIIISSKHKVFIYIRGKRYKFMEHWHFLFKSMVSINFYTPIDQMGYIFSLQFLAIMKDFLLWFIFSRFMLMANFLCAQWIVMIQKESS